MDSAQSCERDESNCHKSQLDPRGVSTLRNRSRFYDDSILNQYNKRSLSRLCVGSESSFHKRRRCDSQSHLERSFLINKMSAKYQDLYTPSVDERIENLQKH